MESNNGWITDRLPTKEDADFPFMVWVWSELHNRPLQNDYRAVAPGQPWMPIKEPPPYIKPRWKPKEGEVWWRCSSDFATSHIWYGDAYDKRLYTSGNCFQTKEEAEEVTEKIKQLLKEHHDGR